jgi:ribosome-binding factor A
VVSKTRVLRVADRIRDELSEMLVMEISDPRLAGVSVTDVEVDRELAYAEIYVSTLEGSERAREVLEALKHASGYLRHELAQRIDLFTFPRLRFHWDPTFERADKIERLIASLSSQENSPEQPVPASDESGAEEPVDG